jgi:hypothetical protein
MRRKTQLVAVRGRKDHYHSFTCEYEPQPSQWHSHKNGAALTINPGKKISPHGREGEQKKVLSRWIFKEESFRVINMEISRMTLVILRPN